MHQINPVAQYLACRIVIFWTGIIHADPVPGSCAHSALCQSHLHPVIPWPLCGSVITLVMGNHQFGFCIIRSSSMSAASPAVTLIGFSHRTMFPSSQAASVYLQCRCRGTDDNCVHAAVRPDFIQTCIAYSPIHRHPSCCVPAAVIDSVKDRQTRPPYIRNMPGMGNIPASDYNCAYHKMPLLLLFGHRAGQIAFALVLSCARYSSYHSSWSAHIDARAYILQPLCIGGTDKGLDFRRMAQDQQWQWLIWKPVFHPPDARPPGSAQDTVHFP